MVYLLHAYFGRDGREEAEELLTRHSGDADKPRILGTFNEPMDNWLSFFMFTYFTDRDGKFQLKSLAESAFDPLARTCRFMLTEEAHHMFVGETGVGRVDQAHAGSDEGTRHRRRGHAAQSRRDRSAHGSEIHELLVHVARWTCSAPSRRAMPPTIFPTASRAAPMRPSLPTMWSRHRDADRRERRQGRRHAPRPLPCATA